MALTIHDAHCHFLSTRFFEALGREKYGDARPMTAESVVAELGWEAPGTPGELADRWVAELDRHHVGRAALMASVPGDEPSVAAAVNRYRDRFVGFFAFNPLAPQAAEAAARAFGELGLRCACLFPAMHGYQFDDPRVSDLFATAAEHHGVVFAHCGYLTIEARARFGVSASFDLRKGDPLTLASVAARHPEVPVIIPHFGAGFLREALMAADACPNIHLDTSSSNSWIKYIPGLTLAEVFRRALAVAGPDRVLFGTDSSNFPRGWRRVVCGAQQTILDELGVERTVAEKIFSGNFERLFRVGPVPAPG